MQPAADQSETEFSNEHPDYVDSLEEEAEEAQVQLVGGGTWKSAG